MSSNLACLNHSAAPEQNHWPTWTNQPLSLFAQTMLEEEERFYATFPAARRAAMDQHRSFQQASCASQYFGGPGFQYHPDINTYVVASNCYNSYLSDPQVTSAADGFFPVYHTEAPPNPPNYDYIVSIDGSAFPVELTQQGWTEQHCNWESTHLIQQYTTSTIYDPAPSMLPTIARDSYYYIVPSHQPLIDRGLLRPLTVPPIEEQPDRSPSLFAECLSSPTLTQGSLSLPSSPCRDALSPNPAPQQFGSVNLTGNWQTDAMAVNESMLHAPVPRHAFVPDVDSLDVSATSTSPSTRSCQLTPCQRKTRRSNSHPSISANGIPRPSSRMRLSTSPNKGRTKRSTQPKAVASKPPLACLFCRSRKIGCSITEEWAVKKTCNQCDKRGLRCSFPLESYRGVRNKELKVREIFS